MRLVDPLIAQQYESCELAPLASFFKAELHLAMTNAVRRVACSLIQWLLTIYRTFRNLLQIVVPPTKITTRFVPSSKPMPVQTRSDQRRKNRRNSWGASIDDPKKRREHPPPTQLSLVGSSDMTIQP